MFSRNLWNVSSRIIQDLPRTTNALEGWHSALGRSIKIDHPNVWILIRQLKLETVGTLTCIANSQASIPSQSKSSRQQEKKYQKGTQEIQECLQQLNDSELAILPFLRKIAHRIEISI